MNTLKKMHLLIALVPLVSVGLLTGCGGAESSVVGASAIRVGTYNSQAVALAYGRSRPFLERVERMGEQRKQAQAAGDQARVDELEAAGKALQKRLHQQVFSGAAIDEVVAMIADDLARIADEWDLTQIVAEGAYDGPAAQLVDVTYPIVNLFDPTAKTRRYVDQILKSTPTKHGSVKCE